MIAQNIKLAPRWFIFLLDISCFALSMIIAYLLRFNFDFTKLEGLGRVLLITLMVNAVLVIAFRTYAGVIRYTTIEDSKRIFITNCVASIIFIIIGLLLNSQSHQEYFPNSIVLIYFLCANFSMIAYRVAIKYLYENLFSLRKKTQKAIVFNASYEGLLAKKMFTDNLRSSIKITAFLDDTYKLKGKYIENIPVYSPTKANLEKLKTYGVELLIISDPFIKKDTLNQLVDWCLELDIKIQQVPPSEKWMNNELDALQLKNINIEQLLDREVISINNEEVGRELKGKRVLVTGAAGSIGSEIVRQIIEQEPAIVIMCDVAETPLHELSISLPKDAPVKTFIGDISDKVRMEQIFDIYAPQLVYHAAAYKHVPLMEEHPSAAVMNNVLGTKSLAELSVSYGVEKFVMISTDKAVNPTNVMGASKRIAEIFTQSFYNSLINKSKLNGNTTYTRFITTRFGNVLGSNGSVIPRFKHQLDEGGPITVTHPDITRYFMTIPEACRLVLEAGCMGKGGEIFVFDMGEPVKIVDLARKMIKLSGKIPDKDIKIVYSGLRPGEKLYEELLNNAENTMPTYHDKILIAQVREYDFTFVYNQISELIALASQHITVETVAKMKEIVPEFISNNSTFSKLDKKQPK